MPANLLENRRGTTDLTDEYTDRTGKNTGSGRFEEGTATKLTNVYHIDGSSESGYRYRTFIDEIYIGYEDPLNLAIGETFDMSGLDFILGENVISFREPTEQMG